MKLHLHLCVVMAIGTSSAADSDWLPPPDGFAWPEESEVRLTGEESLSVGSFSPQQREALAGLWEGPSLPKSVMVRRADLNGDGVLELFIYMPALSGTGGSVYKIVTPTKSGLIHRGGVMGGITLCEPAKGSKWLQIEGQSKAGGGHFTRYLLQMLKGEYREVRNEDHDYISSKVTIRRRD